jgi:hypothetical protein
VKIKTRKGMNDKSPGTLFFKSKSSNEDLVLLAIRLNIPLIIFVEIQNITLPAKRIEKNNNNKVMFSAQKAEIPFSSRALIK